MTYIRGLMVFPSVSAYMYIKYLCVYIYVNIERPIYISISIYMYMYGILHNIDVTRKVYFSLSLFDVQDHVTDKNNIIFTCGCMLQDESTVFKITINIDSMLSCLKYSSACSPNELTHCVTQTSPGNNTWNMSN